MDSDVNNQTLTDILDPGALRKQMETGLLDAANTLHSINRHVELYTLCHVQATGPGSHGTSSIKFLYDMYEEKHSRLQELWRKLVEVSERSDTPNPPPLKAEIDPPEVSGRLLTIASQ